MIALEKLQPSQRRYKYKRVGRGNASGKGTTAGRGTKGQRARTGGRNRLIRRGMKHLIGRTPKTRGFRSRRPTVVVINLQEISRRFPDGAVITPATLYRNGTVKQRGLAIKVIGQGQVKKKYNFNIHLFSKAAAASVRQAGGTVNLIKSNQPETPK